jgi:hypothetical protein
MLLCNAAKAYVRTQRDSSILVSLYVSNGVVNLTYISKCPLTPSNKLFRAAAHSCDISFLSILRCLCINSRADASSPALQFSIISDCIVSGCARWSGI